MVVPGREFNECRSIIDNAVMNVCRLVITIACV